MDFNELETLPETDASREKLREKMLSMLKIYPIVSPAMMQIAMGTMIPPVQWRPVLEELIEKQEIVREEFLTKSHLGQHRSYTRLRLPETPRDLHQDLVAESL